MKRHIITLLTVVATITNAYSMSYSRARKEALYLTDKMAYELNLNDQQYEDAYEINLDYFLSINNERDLYADYLSYRLTDFRCILLDWQYNLMMASHYFVRPILWRAGCWHFPIYSYYTHGHFYYHRPAVYVSYRGGHGHAHFQRGFYANRRPDWNGGFRGQNMNHPGRPVGGGRGDGYHFTLPNRGQGGHGPAQGYNPGRGSSVSTPSRGGSNATPSRGSNISTPSRGGSVSTPSRGSSITTPSRGGSVSTPSRGHSDSQRGNSFSSSSSRVSRGMSSSSVRSSSPTPSRGKSSGISVSRGGNGSSSRGASRGSR